MEVVATEVLNKSLQDTSVAVQGIGAVGSCLVELLLLAGVSKFIVSEKPDEQAGDPDGTRRAQAIMEKMAL